MSASRPRAPLLQGDLWGLHRPPRTPPPGWASSRWPNRLAPSHSLGRHFIGQASLSVPSETVIMSPGVGSGTFYTPLLGKERPGAVSTCENRWSVAGRAPGNRGRAACAAPACGKATLTSVGPGDPWGGSQGGTLPPPSGGVGHSTEGTGLPPILPPGPCGPSAGILLGLTLEVTHSGRKLPHLGQGALERQVTAAAAVGDQLRWFF